MIDFEMLELEFTEKAEKILGRLESDLSKIQVGRANPNILSSVKVEYYGDMTPINQIAVISVPEPRQLLIKPFDQNIVSNITAAIKKSNLGVEPVDEGDKIRMTFQALTEERRKEMVKSLSKYVEASKVGIRKIRHEANKQLKDAELSEDELKNWEKEVQKWTDQFTQKIDKFTKQKSDDLMSM